VLDLRILTYSLQQYGLLISAPLLMGMADQRVTWGKAEQCVGSRECPVPAQGGN